VSVEEKQTWVKQSKHLLRVTSCGLQVAVSYRWKAFAFNLQLVTRNGFVNEGLS